MVEQLGIFILICWARASDINVNGDLGGRFWAFSLPYEQVAHVSSDEHTSQSPTSVLSKTCFTFEQ